MVWLEDVTQDVRFGLRMLRKSPGYAAMAVLTFALGIGANTAIFSAINSVLLRPLPFPKAERLVMISEASPQRAELPITLGNFSDWQARNRVFDEMAAFYSANFNWTRIEETKRLAGGYVTSGFFPILGLVPLLGRTPTTAEDDISATPVAVLSEGFWQMQFGGDTNVLGRPLKLNGQPYTIVGVVKAKVPLPSRDTQLWVSMGASPLCASRGGGRGPAFARLRPGVSIDQARAEMAVIAKRLAAQFPETNTGISIDLTELHYWLTRDVRLGLLLLLTATAMVLFLACANITNLLLARGLARRQEMSIRLALGARRTRLIRQLLVESLMLASLGGAAGLCLACWLTQWFYGLLPAELPQLFNLTIDARTLGISMGVMLLCGVLFGLAPAVVSSRGELSATLKLAGRSASAFLGIHRLRGGLVVGELALSLVLLVGTGLLIRSLVKLAASDPGFNARNLLTCEIELPKENYPTPDQRELFVKQLTDRLAAVAGIRATAITTSLPLRAVWGTYYFVEGQILTDPHIRQVTDVASISSEYFRAMQIPLLHGRGFNDGDRANSLEVAVVDESFARTYWPNEDPVGKRISFRGIDTTNWITVVGVAAHVKNYGSDADSRFEIYVPSTQSGADAFYLVIRAEQKSDNLQKIVVTELRKIDKSVSLAGFRTMEELLTEHAAPKHIVTVLLGAFAWLALTLAAVGIYGVMAFNVGNRTREIGIRMALGADRRAVLGLVLRQGVVLVGIAVVLGVAGALGMTHVLTKLLYGVKSSDPLTFFAAPLVLILVALLASCLPARRATRVDPMEALRCE
jgi:putative ABC transport system permease protein